MGRGKLGDPAILKGRNAREAITSVTTFTGHAFPPAGDVERLLVLSADAMGVAPMCTAQLAGPQRAPMGMNNPLAPRNAQFCLNAVHWLSGLLDD